MCCRSFFEGDTSQRDVTLPAVGPSAPAAGDGRRRTTGLGQPPRSPSVTLMLDQTCQTNLNPLVLEAGDEYPAGEGEQARVVCGWLERDGIRRRPALVVPAHWPIPLPASTPPPLVTWPAALCSTLPSCCPLNPPLSPGTPCRAPAARPLLHAVHRVLHRAPRPTGARAQLLLPGATPTPVT